MATVFKHIIITARLYKYTMKIHDKEKKNTKKMKKIEFIFI